MLRLALEEDTTALVIHVSKEFFQYFDPNFGMYQFVFAQIKTIGIMNSLRPYVILRHK